MTDDCKQRFMKFRKEAAEEVKRIRKDNAAFNKMTKLATKNSIYYKGERWERKQRLKDAIKFRDVTLSYYEKMECK